jgi:1-acyl-sn-glycerol-3-phosphate acyltransferase
MSNGFPTEPPAVSADAPQVEGAPHRAYAIARSVLRWSLAGGYFFTICPALILLSIFVDPRKNDAPQRWMSRTILRLAGGKLEVRRSPGFDPARTCFFVCNHVNLFDPFILYSTVPQFIRGLELESHFRIPVYGWLMKRFGNVPVPETSSPANLKRMWRLTRAALDSGISLVVFPEGRRTLTGRVGKFQEGVFRMALQFGAPIVPVTVTGSFEFNRKTGWMLRPATIVVYLHDTIETAGLSKDDAPELRDRVWKAVATPINERLPSAEDAATDVTATGNPSGRPKAGTT